MRRPLLLLLALVALPASAWAQGTIRGTVTDDAGEPLPGANVTIVGTDLGAATSVDGEYTITNVPTGTHEVRARFVGFRQVTHSVTVAAGETITRNFVLPTDHLGLDEVVVTALGVERPRQALAYTVQSVRGDELREVPVMSALNALQGKVAGMSITPSSGMPGASAHIQIRGSNSLTGNNQPLFVVDGVAFEGGPLFGGGVAGVDGPNRIADLNPNDIESVTVLKGASATALYGVRASNGVVLITTRRGGQAAANRVNVSVSTNLSFDRVSVLPDLQSTFAQGSGGNFSPIQSLSWGPAISDLPDMIPGPLTPITGEMIAAPTTAFDNVSPFFQTGVTTTNSIDVSGANPFGNYVLSLGYTGQEGIIETTGMRRATARIGGEYTLAPWVRTGGTISYVNSQIDMIPGGSFLSNPLFTLYWAPRSYDLWGTPYALPDNPWRQILFRAAMDNPRWSLAHNNHTDNTTRVFGNVNAEFTPLSGLVVNYRVGADAFTNQRLGFLDLGSGATGSRGGAISPAAIGGEITETNIFQTELTSILTATYNHTISDDLAVSVMAGNDINDYYQNFAQAVGSGLAVGSFQNLSNAASISALDNDYRNRNVGLFADVQLDWRSTVFLNVTGRNDWSSTMPPDARSFFYPGVGAAFAFSELLNLDETSPLTFGKLRASFAQVGQTAPRYSTQPIFSPGNIASGWLNTDFEFPFAGVTGFTMGTQIREGVRPQNNQTWEVGTELAFLGGRVGLDYAYFDERAKDSIFPVPVSTATGFFTELTNAGELRNRGHELVLRAEPVRMGNFAWDMTINFGSVSSEVVSLAEGIDNITLGGFVDPNVRAMEGEAYPVIFGRPFVRDGNGNIVVDSRQTINGNPNPYYGMPLVTNELGAIGNVTPDWTGGILNTFRFGDFRLHAQVDVRSGGMMYAGNTRLQKLYGMDAMTEDRTTPRLFDSAGFGSSVKGYFDENGNLVVVGDNDIEILMGQTFWQDRMDLITESNVYDTSFIRLRELNLSYNVPRQLLQRLLPQAQGLQLSLTGRNLILITDYPNFDPETNLGGGTNFQGFEYVNLPGTRSYGFGLRLSL
jgi:TonB-linked SusC/RagA family outer membrane protein